MTLGSIGKWIGFVSCLTGILTGVRADEGQQDVFATLGMTPRQVVSSMDWPTPNFVNRGAVQTASAWVGMPMTDANREEFIKALAESHSNFDYTRIERWDTLLDMLEAADRVNEALEMLPDEQSGASPARSVQDTTADRLRVRKAGFLIKAGRKEEAARLLESPQHPEQMFPWTSIVAVDIALDRRQQAIETLEFLLRETRVDPTSFRLLASQQLKLDPSPEGVAAMTAENVPTVLRSVRLDLLGRSEEAAAVWQAELPTMSPDDLFRLSNVEGFKQSPGYKLRVKSLIDDPEIAASAKTALLNGISDTLNRLELFFGMKGDHEKIIPKIAGYAVNLGEQRQTNAPDLSPFLPQCDELLRKHPDSASLHLLRASCAKPGDPSQRASLITAAQGGPEESSTALTAIHYLKAICPSEELDRIITQAKSHADLPVIDRLNRFMAAELDHRVIEILKDIDLRTPEGDKMSREIGHYLTMQAGSREIPSWVIERILHVLVPLCVGSDAKPWQEIRISINTWYGFLSKISVADEILIQKAKEINEIVSARKIPNCGDVFQYAPSEIRKGAGLVKGKVPPNPITDIPPWAVAIEMFGHPEMLISNDGFNMGMYLEHRNYDPGKESDVVRAFPLLGSSPWRHAATVTGSLHLYPDRGAEAVRVAAALRAILRSDEKRAGVYDVLVATGYLSCADARVKEMATRHAAAIATTRDAMQTELAVLLHVSRFGADRPEATPPDLSSLSKRERWNLAGVLRSLRYDRSGRNRERPEVEALLTQLEGSMASTEVPEPQPLAPAEVSPSDQLISLQVSGRGRSDEALALARKTMDAFVMEKKTSMEAAERISINLLKKADQFETWLGDTRKRMIREGWSELDTQRALMRVHAYSVVGSTEAAIPYARKVFELDATDLDAARLVLEAALKTKDADLAERCLKAFAAVSPVYFGTVLRSALTSEKRQDGHDSDLLSLFQGAKAADFLRRLIATPFGDGPGDDDSLRTNTDDGILKLVFFALKEAPEQFNAVLQWSGLLRSRDEFLILRLVDEMRKAGMSEQAQRILADRYFSPTASERTEPLRFPARIERGNRFGERIPVQSLAENGMLEPLAKLAESTEETSINRMALARIRLAAHPTMEVWRSVVLPALAASPIGEREESRQAILNAVATVKGSEELRTLLSLGRIRDGSFPRWLSALIDPLNLMASLDPSERAEMLPVLWNFASELLDQKHPDPNRDMFLENVLFPMILLAGDQEWKSYLGYLAKADAVIQRITFSISQPLPTESDNGRLRDIAGLICEHTQPGQKVDRLVLHLISKLGDSGEYDREVAAFRPLVFNAEKSERADDDLATVRRLIELASGDATALLPVLEAETDGNGVCRFRWALAGDGKPEKPTPHTRRFPGFDGRFDISLLAGPEPRKLSRVLDIREARSVGVASHAVPPGARFAAMLATEREGGAIHLSNPVPIAELAAWRDLPLPEVGEHAHGPFEDNAARKYRLGDDQELLLADVPWEGGMLPSFSVWAMAEEIKYQSGVVKVRFVTGDAEADRKESGQKTGQVWAPIHGYPERQWQRLVLSASQMTPPPGTERIQLLVTESAQVRLEGTSKAGFRIAEPKILLKETGLPDGVERIARIRALISCAAFDEEGVRIALANPLLGVGVFDLRTGTFGEWIPFPETVLGRDVTCYRLILAGNRIFHFGEKQEARVFDLEKRRQIAVIPNSGEESRFLDVSKARVSPNGSFAAFAFGISGYEIHHIQGDGTVTNRAFISGGIEGFAFDGEKGVLVTREARRAWVLPLADWKNAEPKLTEAIPPEPAQKISEVASDLRIALNGRGITLQKSDSAEWNRTVTGENLVLRVPAGKLFHAKDDRTAWVITALGSIHRIDLGKLEF